MSEEFTYTPATLDLLDRFLAEYRKADRPADVMARYADRHPDLADEFRLQAGFAMIDPAEEPADLPDITLLREIGRGGMGIVYEGWQESLDRPVAVKLHRLTDPRTERGKFFHECRTLARLHQSSIVPVHAAGRSGPWLYYVMPLIEGATVAELVRRAKGRVRATNGAALPPLAELVTGPIEAMSELGLTTVLRPGAAYIRSAVEVVLMAAEAIEYAHREGVWHLDLKPANLMVDPGGHGWVIDFGVSRRAGSDPGPAPATVVDTDRLAGDLTARPTRGEPYLTLAYAAPERWRGSADARSDVWGLGATLYELLTLRRPFPAEDPTALATAVAESAPVPAWRLADGLSQDLAAVCEKALAKRADDRYQTAGALAADLRHWLDGYETSARPWSGVTRLFRRARRHRPWAVAAGAVVVGLVATLVLLWRQEQAKAEQVKAEGEAALAREMLLREADSHAKSKIWSLVELARQRVNSSPAGRRDDVRRILLAAARERRGTTPDATSPVLDVAFRSLFAESLGALDVPFPPSEDRAELPSYWFRDWPAAIHPDGKLIALGTSRGPLVWARGGPKPKPDPADVRKPRSAVAYSSGGEYLAEMLPDETGGGLRLWDRQATRVLGELIPPGKRDAVVLAVGFDPKDTRLWAVRADGRVVGWDLPGQRPVADWPLAERPAKAVTAAAFGPGASTVAIGDDGGHVLGYDATGAVTVRLAVRPGKAVEALAWAPDGKGLGAGTADGVLHVFDRDGGSLFRANVSAHGVARVVFTPDGQWVTAHFRDAGAKLWDARSGRLALQGRVAVWGFARDGRTMALGSNSTVEFGRLLYPEAVARLAGHQAAVSRIGWSGDGRRMVSLSADYEVRVWDAANGGRPVAAFAAPASHGFWSTQGYVALSPDGRLVGYASGGLERSKAVVYDVEAGTAVGEWDLPGGFETLAASGPGRFVLVREQTRPDTRNVETVVYDLEPGKPLGTGRVIRRSAVGDMARFMEHWLRPDGKLYAWAGPREPATGRRVELFDVGSGRLVTRIPTAEARNDYDPSCLPAEDRRHLWITTDRGDVRLYDLTTRDPPRMEKQAPLSVSADGRWAAFEALPGPGNLVPYVSLRPWPGDNKWVDFGCGDGGRILGGSYLFSPDSKYLAWAGMDGTITLVDVPVLAEKVKEFEAELARAAD